MSTVLRSALGASVLAAVRARKNAKRMSEDETAEKPEDMDDDHEAEGDDPAAEVDEPHAEGDDLDPDGDDHDAEDGDSSAEDQELEGEDKAKAARIRRAEQKRIQAILTHPRAEANPGLAAELAFGGRHYGRKEAVALLAAGGAVGKLASRMAGKSPRIGASAPASPGGERRALVESVRANIQARHGIKR